MRKGFRFKCIEKEEGAMKTIGLIGGMSWESTQHYYQLMNQGLLMKNS